MTTAPATDRSVTVCLLDDLEDNLGAAVLLDDGTQVALFRIPAPGRRRAGRTTGDDSSPGSSDLPTVYAVSNIDPYTGAAVISRGIVGEHHGECTVASPLLKQRFVLSDGRSLEDPDHHLETFTVTVTDGTDSPRRVVLVR
ncbi:MULTISPECIES: nitrite reductase (NAD(P)H) small subunit [Corynebacterium]|jgi:nitrite reductase (NADH) small subunit|uniref:Nitrite reductase (NADH) small subunit n=1 Tax=Corynebacterium provencense TaxID=1737425 RepID=A0A2Z3YTQ8_9CORY|nr:MULTISPECIES: nitrite reductase (NAD(P)H) small subunit [Corynebacterium]AWT25427.1 Nitrite reductase (NADH) small subunit [Corynebacterium provencense]MCI1256186.1 nitrite reductase (NAD(P)H) small subunit [Corynebacterium provencense]